MNNGQTWRPSTTEQLKDHLKGEQSAAAKYRVSGLSLLDLLLKITQIVTVKTVTCLGGAPGRLSGTG